MAVTVNMADVGRDMHPFFMQKAHAGSSEGRGFGVNDEHRKRQKTGSADQDTIGQEQLETTEWIEQLNAAASGALQGSNATVKSTSHQEESSIDLTAKKGVRRGSSTNLSAGGGSLDGSSTCSSGLVNGDVPLGEDILQPARSNGTARTPPKKMLRVRSDGKLRSPKVKPPAQDAKPKRGRKSAKAGTVAKMLVATIKYGTDAQSRSRLGRRIAHTLSGTVSNSSPGKSILNRPSEPPKPTHPFFLGGSKRDQCQQDITQSKDAKESVIRDHPTTPKRGAISPLKARVTSKPPGIPGRSAGMFGLGTNTLSSGHARVSQSLGAMEPLWPPEGMVHVRQDCKPDETSLPSPYIYHTSKARRKMKEAEIHIPKEEQILTRYVDTVQAYQSNSEVSRRVHSREWREFRRPLRRILTGRELQQAVRGRISSKLPTSYSNATGRRDGGRSSIPQMPYNALHPAIHHVFKEIATSLTAFDRYECETQDWAHKYAPACADQVLQAGREVFILRDWLRALTVNSVGFQLGDTSKVKGSSVSSRKATTKRKRRKAEELDGFVLTSGDEANEMCLITDSEDNHPASSTLKKSVVRGRCTANPGSGERVMNAVVISGPHGCGKTAAVHAVARELGFEVFEINAGSRRSGRDILDKVGDMTRNHLVKHAHSDQDADVNEEAENTDLLNEKLKQDLDSGRQGTMNSFFKSKGAPKKSPSKKKLKSQKPVSKQEPPRKHQSQKQSLILLEEVDVLFDEDKTFWATTLELLVQCKRPVIMTCTNESLIPLEDMILHAILRFTHPPEQLATDYLILVACNEGHLLSRDAVIQLYKSKGFDLRASITELNFFCQMAIGDTKGGLEWMLINSPSTNSNDQNQEPLRVISEGTYQTGMSWLSSQIQIPLAQCSVDQETEMLSEAWYGWGLDIGACEAYISPLTTQGTSRTLALQQLQFLDQVAENISVADTFPGRIPQSPDMALLDTARPELTEKASSNYVEGFRLLQADPVVDQTGVAEAIALAIKACSRRLIHRHNQENTDTPFGNREINSTITENMHARASETPNIKFDRAAAFEPIARSTKSVLGVPKGPQISVFDGPLSVIAEDLAPYVRSIVSYDIKLEEQRGILSTLLSQPGHNSKKQRTTRASRAALEGGNKANTRRERWFPKITDFDSVLQSGGKDWQEIALKWTMAEQSEHGSELDEKSRRGSVASAMESDN